MKLLFEFTFYFYQLSAADVRMTYVFQKAKDKRSSQIQGGDRRRRRTAGELAGSFGPQLVWGGEFEVPSLGEMVSARQRGTSQRSARCVTAHRIPRVRWPVLI